MKRVLLLRHAKSAWADAEIADHERPLNRRGERAAEAMASHIVARELRPDLILCSTAIRARQTLAPLLQQLSSPAPPVSLERGLYLASEEALLTRLRAVPDDIAAVMLIGHNDGLWRLAAALAGHGRPSLLRAVREKFPTGALAVFRAPTSRWANIAPGSATLVAFVRPREVMTS